MEKINKIISDVFKISSDRANENLGMKDVENWDSLSHMNLIVSIEDEFKVQLTGDDIAEMITFNSIRQIVSKYIQT